MLQKSSVKLVVILCFMCAQVHTICDRFEKCACEEKDHKHYYELNCPADEDGVNIVVMRDKITLSCSTDESNFNDLIPENLTGIINDVFQIKRLSIEDCRVPFDGYAKEYVTQLGITDLNELQIISPEQIDGRSKFLSELTNLTTLQLEFINVVNIAMFHDLTNLQKLTLRSNNLTRLEGLNLPSLLSLKLIENTLPRLGKPHFSGLGALRELFIIDSDTEIIENNGFDDLKNLVKFEIRSTKLEELPTFKGLKKMEEISIYNRLRNTSDSGYSTIITGLDNLKKITISCGVRSIRDDFFSAIKQIVYINFGSNYLTTFSDNFLTGLKELKTLKLNNNKLKSIPDNFFITNIKLQTIDLSGNLLMTIPADYFRNLPRLEIVNLNDNNITDFNYDALSQTYLEEIRLERNNLTFQNILKCPLVNLQPGTKIKLGLKKNGIKSLYDIKCFLNCTNIHRLDVSSNEIEGIYLDDFKMPDVRRSTKLHLNLDDNDIVDNEFFDKTPEVRIGYEDNDNMNKIQISINRNPVVCDDCVAAYDLINDKFLNPPKRVLQYRNQNLIFLMSNLTCVEEKFCEIPIRMNGEITCPRQCSCLRQELNHQLNIDCRSRKLNSTPEIPQYAKEYDITLDISNNDIKKLYFNFRSKSLHQIKTIYAQNNQINEINFDAFPTQIQEIDVSNNQLEELDKKTVDQLNRRGEGLSVNIDNNPLKCIDRNYHQRTPENHLHNVEFKLNNKYDLKCKNKRVDGHRWLYSILIVIFVLGILATASYIGFIRYKKRYPHPMRYTTHNRRDGPAVELNETLLENDNI